MRKELTPEGFEALLALLDPDRESAGVRYEEIRRRLVRLLGWKGWRKSWPSAEDLADETLNRVAQKLVQGVKIQASNPYSYICGVAHLVHKEAVRRLQQEIQPPEQPDLPSQEEEEPADRRLEALDHCLDRFTLKQRDLFERYYLGEDRIRARKRLSQELGIDMNALRIRVHRLRQGLEACIEETLRN